MTSIDWIIVAFTLLMALWGYMQGLIVGALSLAGFAAGALVGSRLGPLVLEEGSHSPYAPLAALVGALLIGGVLASVLEVLGFHLRRRLGGASRSSTASAARCSWPASGWGSPGSWVRSPSTPPARRELREPIQRSVILRELNAALPPSGPLLKALARFDPFPRIDGPDPGVSARPTPRSRATRTCARPAAAS